MKKVAFPLILTFLISICLSVNTSATTDPQTGFSGVVHYYEHVPGLREVGFEVDNATVVIKNESGDTVKTTKTDDDGFYITGHLPNGKYTITVSIAGVYTPYHKLTKKRIIEDGQSAKVDFILTNEDTRNYTMEYYTNGLVPSDFIDDKEYYQVWNKELIDVDENKEWTINFNQPINPESVNQDTIYITGKWWQKKPNLTFEFLNNNKVLKIKSDYSALGESYNGLYHLYITKDIQSASGEPLKNSIIMDFNLNVQ